MVRSQPLARTVAAGHDQPTGLIQSNAKGDAAATIEADEGLEELSFSIVGSGMRWKTIGPTAGSSGRARLAMSPPGQCGIARSCSRTRCSSLHRAQTNRSVDARSAGQGRVPASATQRRWRRCARRHRLDAHIRRRSPQGRGLGAHPLGWWPAHSDLLPPLRPQCSGRPAQTIKPWLRIEPQKPVEDGV
jgi:hypothetical protein